VNNQETKFTSNSATAITDLISPANAHSGNYGLKLTTDGISLATRTHTQQHKNAAYLSPTQYGYKLFNLSGLYPNGFEPLPAKEYIINAWVKDGQATNRNVNAMATVVSDNNAPVNVPLTCKAIVEGWKLLEGKFTATTANSFKVNLKSTAGDIYIDDIRMHPAAAHLKSYAYNDKNFKLMAELDENAFATFYEYDDEGSLIRVKKETERGIMTIKETRSAYRKNPNAL
jgi:hypothetical protein